MYKNNFLKYVILLSAITIASFFIYFVLFFYPAYNQSLVQLTNNNVIIISAYLEKKIIQSCAEEDDISPLSFEKCSQEINDYVKALNISRMRFFSNAGKVIFSSNKRDIGNFIENKPFFDKVSKGEIYSRILTQKERKQQNFYKESGIIEVYIPARKKDIFIGAFQIYYDISYQRDQLNQIIITFYSLMIPVIIFLLILILLFANKASKSMKEALSIETEANQFKNEFIGSVTHEFRNPLTSILGFAEMGIKRFNTVPREALKKYFSLIRDATNQLIPLINDILDLSKLRAGKLTYSMKSQNLLAPIQYIADEFTYLLEDKHLELNIIHNDINTNAFFDSRRIIQVFRNLLSNAIKFSPENGEITIRIKKKNITNKQLPYISKALESIVISIENNGPHINEEDLKHIFQPFFQSKHRAKEGTGLGLSISNRIITAHRGLIFAENKPGEAGTIFYFSIPIRHPIG